MLSSGPWLSWISFDRSPKVLAVLVDADPKRPDILMMKSAPFQLLRFWMAGGVSLLTMESRRVKVDAPRRIYSSSLNIQAPKLRRVSNKRKVHQRDSSFGAKGCESLTTYS